MTGEPHRVLREQLGAYALGQLSGERWRAVHDHLAVCGHCRADLEEVAPVAGLLGVARARLRPDDHADVDAAADVPPLSDALIDEVRASGGGAAPGQRRTRRRWLPVAVAVAVLAAGAVGYVVGDAARGPRVPVEGVAVRALDPTVQARADLVAHTWGMEVKLTATGFAPGTPYTVTVTDDAGRTVGAGEFIGTGDAEVRCNLNSSVLRADAATVQVMGADGQVVLNAVV